MTPEQLVLSLIDLPFLQVPKIKDQKGTVRYAVVLKEARASYENWCHPVEDGVSAWHRTEVDAQACFDQHHPGVRDALAYVESLGLTNAP